MVIRLIITVLLAAGVSCLITPRLIRFCHARNLVVKPDGRRHHSQPTPQLGGFSIYIGFLFAVLVAFPFISDSLAHYPQYLYGILGTVIAGGLVFLMGLFDDLFVIRPITKLFLQITIAVCLVVFGIHIDFVSGPFSELVFLPLWISGIITIFWVVAVMNAINLTDGLDGLAGGISLIAGIVFMAIALTRAEPLKAEVPAFLSAAMIGGIIGFLPYNFPHAKIFLGDSGSQLLGFLLATIAILGAFKGPTVLALAIPVLVLGIPILDTSLAIVRRGIRGQKIYEPDDEHLHHTMVKKGLSPVQTTLILCAITIVLGIVALNVSGCE